MMKAAVFLRPGKIALADKPIPIAGPGESLVKITTTTICGTDVHILTGDYPVAEGLTIGHGPVGVIAELGAGVTGYAVGQRVVVGAITHVANATHASMAISRNAVARLWGLAFR